VTLTLAQEMLYTTVKVSGFRGSTPVGTGTGFFWSIHNGQLKVDLLATNKHVIAGCDRLEMVCHLANKTDLTAPTGQFSPVSIELGPSNILMHPDPNIDLCGVVFGDLANQARIAGAPLFFRSLAAENVPSLEQWTNFDAIEDVLMVGCPRCIYDEANNHPIVRRGITATALDQDYNRKPEFIVDMACFPGSSGSPVFINQLGYVDRKSGNYMVDARRFFFVGVLYAGPQITNTGEIKFGSIPTVEVAAMMHLGQVVKSTMMLEIDHIVKSRLGW
jgi:hypothetical protein